MIFISLVFIFYFLLFFFILSDSFPIFFVYLFTCLYFSTIIDAFFSQIIFIFSDDWEIAKEFLLNLHSKTNPLKNTEMDGFSCVIKPCRGSASYGVSKACSLEEAERMFRGLLGKIYFICLFFFSPKLLIILIFVLLLIYVEMNYLKKTEFSFIIY